MLTLIAAAAAAAFLQPQPAAPAPAAAPAALAAAPATSPRPIGPNPVQDYPPAALRAGEQGVVGVELTVTPQGRVSACRITRSSGSASLDYGTCRAYTSFGRFRPATDAAGNPVEGLWTTEVAWSLSEVTGE